MVDPPVCFRLHGPAGNVKLCSFRDFWDLLLLFDSIDSKLS